MIALIDNFDSFTYNIYQSVCQLTDQAVRVFRNDALSLPELEKEKPDFIIISPGPGDPDRAGISLETVRAFAGRVPILGICLGHQTIGRAFGGRVVGAREIVHGKIRKIRHDGKGLFRRLKQDVAFTRYHSLAVEESSLPDCLEISARSEDGEIMGLRHKQYLVEGVQFHPESIGSEDGRQLLKNFLHYKKEPFERQAVLDTLVSGRPLSRQMAADFFDELTEGDLSPVYVASVLAAVTARGVTAEELAGCAGVLRRKKRGLSVPFPVIDTCGTGGDGAATFNVSSFAALIAAAAGAKVAKHGNRAVSSKSGCADFYKALGMNIEMSPQQAEASLEAEGFAFLFAPLYHKSMRHAAPVRAEMGVKTVMNLLGPLANPADAAYQLIGVYDEKLCPIVAEAARLLGGRRVMVVHSRDGLDEISVSAPTRIVFIDESGRTEDFIFDPADLGISGRRLEEVIGGTAAENAALAALLFAGEGPASLREICCLNAGAALFVYGTAGSIAEGYRLAGRALASGAVKQKLEAVIRLSRAD